MKDTYFAKKEGKLEIDLTVEFKGLIISELKGFDSIGKPLNIYTKKWVDSNKLDCYIPDEPVYENGNMELTFWITDQDFDVDVKKEHDRFIEYLRGITSIRSMYLKESNDFLFNSDYSPTSRKYGISKGGNFVTGTIKLTKINAINEHIDE